jgi:hypothetical protein
MLFGSLDTTCGVGCLCYLSICVLVGVLWSALSREFLSGTVPLLELDANTSVFQMSVSIRYTSI